MDSKNTIAAIALSSAVIVLYSLFFIPEKPVTNKNLIEKRVKITHQKLKDQNKIDKEFKLLVKKRVKLTHKKLIQQKISR